MPLAQQALDDAVEAVPVHAEGADPHRDLPEARRLRGAQRRPARHDRRARRLLRPRRHDGLAAGAAAGRVPVGGDAVARAGARHHAADVEPARAALADRRHLGVRGEAARGPSGGARWTSTFAALLDRDETPEAARPERGVHEPAARSRSPTTRRRCSSSTSSATYGDDGLHKLLRAYGEGLDTDAALKTALEHRLRRAAGRVRPDARARCSAACARRWRRRRGRRAAASMPLDAAEAVRGRAPGQLSRRRWRSAARCARPDELDEAMQAFERAAALVPMATGARQPARADGRDRAGEEGHRARDHGADRRSSPSTSTTSTPRGSSPTLLQRQRASHDRGAGCGRSTSASSPIDPFDADAHAHARAAWRCSANEPDAAVREFQAVLALGPVDRRCGAHRSRRKLLQGGKRAEAKQADAGGARDRAELRARAGPAAEARGGAAVNGPVRRDCAVAGRLAVGVLGAAARARAGPPAARRRAAAARRADDRFAGLQWRFVRIKYHYTTEGTRVQQDFYGEPWLHRRAGRRAEPVAPRQDRDLDPGRTIRSC